ncbi:DNA mismatch repair protein MutH [Elysia marginata]|uniref:DNA-directed DNA polymerase n=1 Tax=Elysia marginata TaxID=1093978 RepID=A0AAV4J0V0_9GAST|nr:DNA mismatch repair protein MutH [Elysia marginata]
MTFLYVYEKKPVLLKAKHLLSRWPMLCGRRELKKGLGLSASTKLDNVDVACVSLMGIPIVKGKLLMSQKVHIMCVYTGYTIYKTVQPGDIIQDQMEVWKLADCDTYSLRDEVQCDVHKFKEVLVTPMTFLNPSDAHALIAESHVRRRSGFPDAPTIHNNSHEHIDEFVYHTLSMRCQGGECGGKGTSILLFDGKPLCRVCFPDQTQREMKGTPLEPPLVFALDGLTDCPEPLREQLYTKSNMVTDEYVTFMHPSQLPFVKGKISRDAALSKQFMSCCASLVYDIETISVTPQMHKIPDRIVTITAAVCKGQRITQLIMFCVDKPNHWVYTTDVCSKMETGRLLKGLCERSLPDLTLVKCTHESDLIDKFTKFFISTNGHLLVHYNGDCFDTPFVIRASVANEVEGKLRNDKSNLVDRSKFFHNRVNVYTHLVNAMVTEPFKDPFMFQRPAGKYCSGLLPKDAMDVGYNTLTSVTSVDLMPIHDNNSLAVACVAMGIDEGKMEGVSHADIPRLFYAKDEKFWLYALMDVVATSFLLFKSWFRVIGLFKELEKLNRTPACISMSRKKTCVAKTTSYVQFQATGFLKASELRPKRVLDDAVMFELAHFFTYTGHAIIIPETHQLITDFCNGNCKCNTTFKRLPPLVDDCVENVKRVINWQLSSKALKGDSRERQYTTVDALILMHYVTRQRLNPHPFEPIITKFRHTLSKDAEKSVAMLIHFLEYLCNVRRYMSATHEDPAGVWKEYKDNYNVDTSRMINHMWFWLQNHTDIIRTVRQKSIHLLLLPHNTKNNTQALLYNTITEVLKEKRQSIVLETLPFNGAINMFQKPVVDVRGITSVMDYESLYPNVILKSNMGLDTWVSPESVIDCVKLYMERRGLSDFNKAAVEFTDRFVNFSMTRRCDDEVHWVHYVTDLGYLRRNCVFFVKTITSVQNYQYRRSKDNRVMHKRLSADPTLSDDQRESYMAMSLAEKEILNSYYGTIRSTICVGFQATVTAGGRRELLAATQELQRRGYRIVNGDTDSAFYVNDAFDVQRMAVMTVEEMFTLLMAEDYGMSFDRFLEVYNMNYPLKDLTDTKAVKLAAGRVIYEVDCYLCAAISPPGMKLDAEKTFAAYIAPCPKKYTAVNCITDKPYTRGLSSHNKTAIPLTKDSLSSLRELAMSHLTDADFLAALYLRITEDVILPIDKGEMPCVRFGKPDTFNVNKVADDSKRGTLLKSLTAEGMTILYEKLKTIQVPILPTEPDKYWSLCDITNQSCDGRVHKMKVKYQILTELITILGSYYPSLWSESLERKRRARRGFQQLDRRCIQGDSIERIQQTPDTEKKKKAAETPRKGTLTQTKSLR